MYIILLTKTSYRLYILAFVINKLNSPIFILTGESGIDAFNEEARARNICIATTEKIPHSANDKKFDDVIQNLRRKNRGSARVVILFLRVEDAK